MQYSNKETLREEYRRLWAELGDYLAEEKQLYEVRDPEMPPDNELIAVLQRIDEIMQRLMLIESLL